MPNGDVYDRKVDRWWQPAARRVFEADDDELAVTLLEPALGRTMKHGGCPGIDAVAAITEEALGRPDMNAIRRKAAARAALVRIFVAHVRDAEAFFAMIDRPGWGRSAQVTQLGLPALTAAG